MIIYSLLQGSETQRRLDALFILSQISSKSIRNALSLHFVKGYALTMCELLSDVAQQNLSRGIANINHTHKVVENIYHVGGISTPEGFDLLLKFFKFDETREAALRMYYVRGERPSVCYNMLGMKEQHFTRAKSKVESKIKVIEDGYEKSLRNNE